MNQQQQVYDQQSAQIAKIYNQRENARLRATRCVEEMNWRLNPSGDVTAIEIKKVKQALDDLTEALEDMRRAEEELKRFPCERRAQP